MKKLLITIIFAACLTGCATLTNSPMTPVTLSFSDGSYGECSLTNKRGVWSTQIPATVEIRRSDDILRYDCATEDGRKAVGGITSTIGAKIVASAVFLDLGIVDSITDKHRIYPANFVIPVKKKEDQNSVSEDATEETTEKATEDATE